MKFGKTLDHGKQLNQGKQLKHETPLNHESPQFPKSLIRSPLFLTQAAIIAAAYIILTYPFASLSFGPIQFRLSEALTVLAALTPSAIPGLFLGCLLTNTFFNPSPLGPIDIVFGSLATLVAATLTWYLARRLQKYAKAWHMIFVLMPAVVINALVVGTYLPFLIPEMETSWAIIGGFILSIGLSEAVVVYLIGWPLLLGLIRTKIIKSV
ncbi:MAG: QueT transporter family protein [Eubacteriales bacterium]|nr:QueT transporter family protein [Eubacteriales bacterium]